MLADLDPGPAVVPEEAAGMNGLSAALARAVGGAQGLLTGSLRELEAGRLEAASSSLAEVRARYAGTPEADEAAFWLAEAARRRGRPDEAISFLRLVRGQRAEESAWRLAWLLEGRGRSEEAAALVDRAAEGDDVERAADALCWRGLRLLAAGRPAQARQALEEALEAGGSERRQPFLLALALSRRDAGDPVGAEQALLRLLLALPDHPVTRYSRLVLGFVLIESGKPREAAHQFSWYLEEDAPPEAAARARYGRLVAALAAEGVEVAASALRDLAEDGPWAAQARLDLAWAACQGGDWARALEWLRGEAPTAAGASHLAAYLRGCSLAHGGRSDEALRCFEEVPPTSPLEPAALLEAARAALAGGAATRAADLLSAVTSGYPAFSRRDVAWLWLAEARTALGQPDLARRALEAVDPSSAVYPEALFRRGWMAYQAERWDEAAQLLGRLSQDFPADDNRERALLALARAEFQRRSVGRALQALDALDGPAASAGSRDATRFTRAWMLARTGREDQAAPLLTALLAEDPRGPFAARAHHTLARMALRRGDCATALPQLEAVLSLAPEGELAAEAQAKRADCLYALGRYQEALAAYRSLAEDPAARFGAGLALAKLGRLDDLEAAAAGLASTNEASARRQAADLYGALGRGRAAAREDGRAAEAWQRAADLLQGEEAARARLEAGRGWLGAGDLHRGVEALAAAASSPGSDGEEALRALAPALEQSGQDAEAAQTWDRLAARARGDERIAPLRRAARLWASLGDVEGAENRLRDALSAASPASANERRELLSDMGELLLGAGRPVAALTPLTEAAEAGLGPEGLRALALLARAQRATGRDDEALETYLRIGYLYPPAAPTTAQAVQSAAEGLEALHRPDRARGVYQILAREAPREWSTRARERLEALLPPVSGP